MKLKDKQALRNMTIDELNSRISELENDSVKAQNEIKLGKLKNVRTKKNLRYEIALIKTIITEKQLVNQEETE